MKQKSLSQMNEERKEKTVDNDLLNASNTEHFKHKPEKYNGGKAYTEFLKLFFKGGKTD
jgi:hypothetical protein